MNLIPTIGAKGIYKVAAPFDTVINSKTKFTCVAIRRLADIIGNNIDPYSRYYERYSIPESTYEADLKGEVCIISLQSEAGALKDIPSSFILSYPLVNGIPYNCVSLLVDIGAIPDELNLSAAMNSIKDTLKATVGITPTIKTVITSETVFVSSENHKTAEVARLAKVTKSNTDYSELITLRDANLALKDKVAKLEQYIKALPTPTP